MISKTIFSVASSRLVSAAVTFITSLFLIRELSITEYGDLFFLISLITFFSTLPNVGTNNYFVYNNECSKLDSWIYTKTIIFFAAILIIIPICITLESEVMFAVLIGLIFSLFDTALTVYQAQQKFRLYSLLLPAKNIVLLILLYVFSKNAFNLNLLNAYFLTALLFTIPLIFLLVNNSPPSKYFSLELLKGAKGFFLFEFFSLIIIRSETWLIKFFESIDVVENKTLGIYGIVFGLCSGLSIVSNSIQSVLLPKIKKNAYLLNGRAFSTLLFYTLSAGASYYLLVNVFLFFYKREVFSLSVLCSAIFIMGICVSFVASLLRLHIFNIGSEEELNTIYIVQLILTFLFGGIFIMLWGAIGAAISFTSVRVIGLLLMIKISRNEHATY